jgi:stage V sporulation protein S
MRAARERFTGAEYTGCYLGCQLGRVRRRAVPNGPPAFGGDVIETLRVSAGSRPNAVAGAIAALLRQQGVVEVQAIGPHAVNQAVKALAVARSYLEDDELDLTTAPSFVKLELQSEERTAVRFDVRAVPAPLGATRSETAREEDESAKVG